MTEFEAKLVPVGPAESLLGGFYIDVCKTCSALVFDKERHHIFHAWPHMTLTQKLNYAKKKRAAGEDDEYSDSIVNIDRFS